MAESTAAVLPWIAAPLRHVLRTSRAHALLLHGPAGVGQFELAQLLGQAWLCENEAVPIEARPCGSCASCRLVAARTHPDLLVVLPEALRDPLGWGADADDSSDERTGKKKPSKEIRVEEMRRVVAFASTTSARGRGKAVVVHPAERMNAIAANAFLKTLEEPAGNARFLLGSASPATLLPTIRSRCQAIAMPIPPREIALAWLKEQGVDAPETLLDAAGGQPQDVLSLVEAGVDAALWRALPGRVAGGDAAALRGWALPRVVETLQKLCHDAASVSVGAPPRYFPAASVPVGGDLAGLSRWSRELVRFASHDEHPWIADLSIESLVEQGRRALQKPRIAADGRRHESIHSVR